MSERTAGTASGTHTRAVLAIDGMHCGSCAALVEETLLEDLGVVAVKVDLGAHRASVTYDPSVHTLDDLCQAVAAAGYEAHAVGDSESG